MSLAANKLIKLQCYQSLQNHPTGPLSNCNLHLFPSLLACREGKFERQILVINESPASMKFVSDNRPPPTCIQNTLSKTTSVCIICNIYTHNHLNKLVSFWNYKGNSKIRVKKPFSLIFRSGDECRGVAIFEPASWRMHWTCRITTKHSFDTCVHVCSCSPKLSVTNQNLCYCWLFGRHNYFMHNQNIQLIMLFCRLVMENE